MKVLLVTTWDQACGIAEHSRMLKAAVEQADPSIEIVPSAEALDASSTVPIGEAPDLIHLNYQASLHSRWTAEAIRTMQQHGWPVLVTYHDTGVPNSEQCRSVIAAADAAVVHEPFDDLPPEKTHYWRMGVPAAVNNPLKLHVDREDDRDRHRWCGVKRYSDQPVLGSIGFPFPWKNYDQLAEVTRKAGWALLLIAPTATEEQIDRWTAVNPDCLVYTNFVEGSRTIRYLNGCDATAFTYVTHNTGQSGAVLQGIAARKPVIAFHTCRQFRALYGDPLGRETIRWCATFDEVGWILRHLRIQRVDPGIVALAEQESWQPLGQKYADLYRRLAA